MHVGGMAVVLCALPVEYQAVRPLLTDLEARELPGGSLFEEGMLSGTPWRVALGQLGEGNVGAGILAERAMRFFLPDLVLFVGVAGALKDDVQVGDVVVATRVDAYQGGKAAEDFLGRPRTWDADHRLEQRARHLAVTGGWPPTGLARLDGAVPAVHFKPIAAGDVVLASRDSPLYERLRLHYNDAVAIEMEGAGLAQAAHVNDALPALVIRGISDTTGPDKQTLDSAGWQPRAASHAASFAAALLRSLPPSSLPRRRASPDRGATGTSSPAGRFVWLSAVPSWQAVGEGVSYSWHPMLNGIEDVLVAQVSDPSTIINIIERVGMNPGTMPRGQGSAATLWHGALRRAWMAGREEKICEMLRETNRIEPSQALQELINSCCSQQS